MAEKSATAGLRERRINAVILLAFLAWPLTALAMDEIYYVNLASRAAILALAGVGLNFALGFGGLISFGHAAFFGIGGYVAGIAATHALNGTGGTDNLLLIWPMAMGIAAAASLLIGLISLRTSGVYFIMITLAFAQMIYFFAISWPGYGGQDGLPIYVRGQFPGLYTYDHLTYFFLAFAALLLALALSSLLIRSRFGAALTMARLNEMRLATSGIEPGPIRLAAFIVSAMITALAGALYADLNGFTGPSMLSWHRSGEIMIFVILGGVGRLCGPLLGAVLFVLLEHLIGGATEHWQLFLGLILLGVVLFARGGLMGLLAGRAQHG